MNVHKVSLVLSEWDYWCQRQDLGGKWSSDICQIWAIVQFTSLRPPEGFLWRKTVDHLADEIPDLDCHQKPEWWHTCRQTGHWIPTISDILLTVKQTDGLEKPFADFCEGVSSRGCEGMMTKMIYKLCDKEVNKQPITRQSRQVADGRTVRAGMWEGFAIFLYELNKPKFELTRTYRQFWSGLRPEQEANFLLRWARWRLMTHTH